VLQSLEGQALEVGPNADDSHAADGHPISEVGRGEHFEHHVTDRCWEVHVDTEHTRRANLDSRWTSDIELGCRTQLHTHQSRT